MQATPSKCCSLSLTATGLSHPSGVQGLHDQRQLNRDGPGRLHEVSKEDEAHGGVPGGLFPLEKCSCPQR
jgi:hypothetical protein